jgi:hypothetical protein
MVTFCASPVRCPLDAVRSLAKYDATLAAKTSGPTCAYNPAVTRRVTLVAACGAAVIAPILAPAAARGDGTVVVGGSPRAIGRAGTGTVGDDGAGALLLNPAAMARRNDLRVQVGVAYIDDGIDWKELGSGATGVVARNQIGALAAPTLGVEDGYRCWVFGLAAMTSAISDRQLQRFDPSLLASQFDYRYTGIGGGVRRDTVTLGAARRLGDHASVGLAIAGSRVSVAETRRIWAGFSGIDTIGNPNDDVQLELAGADPFSPSAVAGVLIAPDLPIEIGASVGWQRDAHVSGTVAGFGASGGPLLFTNSTAASMVLPQPVTARAGVRYLADRFVVEVDGDVFVFPHDSTSNAWALADVVVQNVDRVRVDDMISRLAPQTHAAVRASIDVQLIAGFLWATAGYAYTSPGTSKADLSPTLADMGGHTVAAGIEANAGGFTVTLGVSRTWSGVVDQYDPAWQHDNPLPGGDAPVPPGELAAVTTQFGIQLDAQLDKPR